jgi:hypothetical protein
MRFYPPLAADQNSGTLDGQGMKKPETDFTEDHKGHKEALQQRSRRFVCLCVLCDLLLVFRFEPLQCKPWETFTFWKILLGCNKE